MKRLYQAIKGVALIISPLLLSFTIIFFLFLAFGKSVSPYFKAIDLLLQDKNQSAPTQGYENIFQGYEKNDAPGTVVDGVTFIDGNDIVFPKRGALYAKLSLPSVGMETDVYFDDSDAALNRGGVGQSYSSKIPGYGKPILISGHNNGKFNALQHLKVGDTVVITTNYGIFEYRVRECVVKDRSDPTAANLQQEKEELILYTCYPFSMLGLTRQRYFVYADKISGPVVLH